MISQLFSKYIIQRRSQCYDYIASMRDYEYGTVGCMRIIMGNCSTRRKSTPLSISPPQIPHDQTMDRTRPLVGSRRWAVERPESVITVYGKLSVFILIIFRTPLIHSVPRLLSFLMWKQIVHTGSTAHLILRSVVSLKNSKYTHFFNVFLLWLDQETHHICK
jgi:hypothetical protein